MLHLVGGIRDGFEQSRQQLSNVLVGGLRILLVQHVDPVQRGHSRGDEIRQQLHGQRVDDGQQVEVLAGGAH